MGPNYLVGKSNPFLVFEQIYAFLSAGEFYISPLCQSKQN
jgi:hypothetical protein